MISKAKVLLNFNEDSINGPDYHPLWNEKHPILGYNKMHRGTDFAAPSGTPIMASGSGTVTRARWCGGGGNCVNKT